MKLTKFFVTILAFSLLFLCISNQTFPQIKKIRIIKQDAVLKVKPDFSSVTIAKLGLGETYNIEDVFGDWISIKLPPDENGISILGYVHSSFIELMPFSEPMIERKAIEKEKQIAQAEKEVPLKKITAKNFQYRKFEISLFGGSSYFNVSSKSRYNDNWSYNHLNNISENNETSLESDNSSNFGGSFAFFFHRNFGIQLQFTSISKINMNPKTDFSIDWSWDKYTYPGGSYSEDYSWEGKGELGITQIGFSFIGKATIDFFEPYLSVGVGFYFLNFIADAYAGYGVSAYYDYYYYWRQLFDIIKADIRIPNTKWTSFGGNLSAGVNFNLLEYLKFFGEARMLFCPEKELHWEWVTGRYEGLFGNLYHDLQDMDPFSPVIIKPAYFNIQLGMKIII